MKAISLKRGGFFSCLGRGALSALCIGFLTHSARASDTFDAYTDSTFSDDWDTAANWSAGLPSAYNDIAYFDAQVNDDLVTFSQPAVYVASPSGTVTGTNQPNQIDFGLAGYGFTVGTPSSTYGLVMADYHTITVLSSLQGNGGFDTFYAPIEAEGRLVIGNFSPTNESGDAVMGDAGYDNSLNFDGTITMDTASNLSFLGDGAITIDGNIQSSVAAAISGDTMSTVTFGGTNTFTGATVFGGTLILDYTTNNTNKLGTTAALNLGSNTGNGGHLIVEGNASAATTQTVGSLVVLRGENSIEVDGNPGAPATFAVNSISSIQTGGTVDFNANAEGAITTTSGNGDVNNNSINILGPYATYDKTYWAVANQAGQTNSSGQYQGSVYATYVKTHAATTVAIGALTTDDGDAFNNKAGNFTVDSGGQTLNATALGTSQGADTVRFISGGTLDLGGGTLSMLYGGVMATSGTTANTTISDGTLSVSNVGGFGLDLYNYGTGTLTIAANITNTAITKSGSGNVVLSGNNSAITNQTINLNSGKLTVGSATALGSTTKGLGSNLEFGDDTATLDTAGFNINIDNLNSDINLTPGNTAASVGLNSQIINSKAGSVSTITVAGASNITATNGNSGTADTSGRANLGIYYGGINEASGAIIGFDIERGNATAEVQLDLGTANPYGDPTGGNSITISGLTGANDVFTGAVTVGTGANLALVGYSSIQTFGAFTLNGIYGQATNQIGSFGTTYLTGTGSFLSNNLTEFFVNENGSAPDTFSGTFGAAGDGDGVTLEVGGTGNLTLANNSYLGGLTTYGTSNLILRGVTNGANFTIGSGSEVELTGTSGVVGGGSLVLLAGTVDVAPSGSGAAVSVSSIGTQINVDDDGTLILDKGQNTSLTYTMGVTTSAFSLIGTAQDAGFLLGSAQGLSALGTTDKFVLLSSTSPAARDIDGMYSVLSSGGTRDVGVFGVDYSANSPLDATFLTYVGTGTAADAGFEAVKFAAGNINNINSSTSTSLEDITNAQTLSASRSVYGLEIDKGGSLALNGDTLTFGDTTAAYGAIILNGGSITGSGSLTLSTSAFGHIYTDLDNGTISSLNVGGNGFGKDGAGTLYVNTLTAAGGNANIIVNDGALDLGAALSASANDILVAHGGVLQGSGLFTRTLGGAQGDVAFGLPNDFSDALGGGFSARGGALIVNLRSTTGSLLTWGTTAYFLQEGSVFDFGSTTADSEVLFSNSMDLGAAGLGNSLMNRVIDVTANSSDTGDALTWTDLAVLSGNISSVSNPYVGLSKTGTGVLELEGQNTYTGPTTISQGTLVITSDQSLGTAPTAAYALNTTPGATGNALVEGAVDISGGAALAVDGGNDVVLSANRQILLASGTTGATPSILNVSSVGGQSELDFGGIIADYVGEVGSLQKQGGGLFNYSGTAANTGADSVVAGTFQVSGSGSINSISGFSINNAATGFNARLDYTSTQALTRAVTFGANGGTFSYNSAAAYTGSTTMTLGANAIVAGRGNLGQTAFIVGSGATLMPGDVDPVTGKTTIGTLTTGGVTLLGGGNYNFLIADATGAAGVGYSTIDATSVNLASLSSTLPFDINIETLANGIAGAPSDFNPDDDYSFAIFNTAPGGITQLTQAQLNADFQIYATAHNGAAGFDPAPGSWYVTEAANGSSLDLNYQAIPEPSIWAMLSLGLGLAVVARQIRSARLS